MSVEALFNDSLTEGGTQVKHSSTSHLINVLFGAAATEVSAHIDKDFACPDFIGMAQRVV